MEGARTIAPDELRASAAAARDARMADRDAAAPEHDDDDDDAGDADGDADAEMGGGGKRTRAADGSAAKPDFPRLKQQAVRAPLDAAPCRPGHLTRLAPAARGMHAHARRAPPRRADARRARRPSTGSCSCRRTV
mgnify:CR=1 FL=1